MIDATKAHETRWTGELSGAAFKALVTKAIATEIGAPLYGNDLKLHFVDPCVDGTWEGVTFELVHDHDWFLKEPPLGADRGTTVPADDA